MDMSRWIHIGVDKPNIFECRSPNAVLFLTSSAGKEREAD